MNLPRLGTEKARMAVVPLPPTAEQHRIVAKVDELMGLCDALEARTSDSLKAHQTLVETFLATLTSSKFPEDLTQNWNRIEEHFDTLFTTEKSIESLRKTVYLLATQGKLAGQRTTEKTGHDLLQQIENYRSRTLKSGYPNEKEAKTQIKKQSSQELPKGVVRASERMDLGNTHAGEPDGHRL